MLLTAKQVMNKYGISKQTLNTYRLTGKIRYKAITPRKFMYYPLSELETGNTVQYSVIKLEDGKIITTAVDMDVLKKDLNAISDYFSGLEVDKKDNDE